MLTITHYIPSLQLDRAKKKKGKQWKKSGNQPLQEYYEYLLDSIAINFNNNFVKTRKKNTVFLKQPKLCV